MGCDVVATRVVTPPRISIHAPAWGATPMWQEVYEVSYISIHAPAWGATGGGGGAGRGRMISIHAPAWGAT